MGKCASGVGDLVVGGTAEWGEDASECAIRKYGIFHSFTRWALTPCPYSLDNLSSWNGPGPCMMVTRSEVHLLEQAIRIWTYQPNHPRHSTEFSFSITT